MAEVAENVVENLYEDQNQISKNKSQKNKNNNNDIRKIKDILQKPQKEKYLIF